MYISVSYLYELAKVNSNQFQAFIIIQYHDSGIPNFGVKFRPSFTDVKAIRVAANFQKLIGGRVCIPRHPVISPEVWCLIYMFLGSSHTEPQFRWNWM